MGNSTTAAYYTDLLYSNQHFPSTYLTTKIAQYDVQHCIHFIVNSYLCTLLYADYREYLDLANIITSQQSTKLEILTTKSPLPNEFSFLKKDINKFNTILFKGEYQQVRAIAMKQLNISIESTEELWQWAAGILIIGLFQQMMHTKINVSGLIKSIHKNELAISSELSTEMLEEIKRISSDNRKRSRTYTSGFRGTRNNIDSYLLLGIISLVAIVFFVILMLVS